MFLQLTRPSNRWLHHGAEPKWASMTFFFFSRRRRHTRFDCDWSPDVCSSDLAAELVKKDPEPLLVLARIYAEQGRMVEAREAVLEALDRDPQNVEALELQRGWKVRPQ